MQSLDVCNVENYAQWIDGEKMSISNFAKGSRKKNGIFTVRLTVREVVKKKNGLFTVRLTVRVDPPLPPPYGGYKALALCRFAP